MRLSDYPISSVTGFLPAQDPLQALPPYFTAWEHIAGGLPALLMAGKLRAKLQELPVLDAGRLEDDQQRNRAMLLLTVLGNACVWGDVTPTLRIPKSIAIPLWQIAEHLRLPPIVSHAHMALHNWQRLDVQQPIALDNLAPLQLFLGGLDEHWFYMVTVAIEAEGGPIVDALVSTQLATESQQVENVVGKLLELEGGLRNILALLNRMPEKCDPYIFYHRIRPYVAGWPEPGVLYEGVSDTPYKFAGGSAAQSPLLQAIDAGLGVRHENPETQSFLMEMRRYMLPAHRQFIEALEQQASTRSFVLDHQSSPILVDTYNRCLKTLDAFRQKHIEISVRYILHQADKKEAARGTGGTNFVSFLGAARKETKERLIT
jgi:indoleamine 2,3-dioxygenase